MFPNNGANLFFKVSTRRVLELAHFDSKPFANGFAMFERGRLSLHVIDGEGHLQETNFGNGGLVVLS